MSIVPTNVEWRSRPFYRAWTQLQIRFGDQDVLGHVNNGAISAYLEHTRCEHVLSRVKSCDAPTLDLVLARIVVDYLREIRYPGTVDMGIRMTRMGGRSFTVASAVFVGETCCAVSEATVVIFDTVTRRSTEPTPAIRIALQQLQ